jgi:hypothetical protein
MVVMTDTQVHYIAVSILGLYDVCLPTPNPQESFPPKEELGREKRKEKNYHEKVTYLHMTTIALFPELICTFCTRLATSSIPVVD